MYREDLLMMQLLGGGGGWLQSGDWLKVVFLAFLLAVPILWPDRIRVVSSYRGAYMCFAFSIIVPSAASVLMATLITPGGMPGGGSGGDFSGMQIVQMCNAAGPVLFGISLILAMKAVVPGFIPPRNSYPPTSHDEPPAPARGSSFDGDAAESKSS